MLCVVATVCATARSEQQEVTLIINQGRAEKVECDDCTLLVKANDFGRGTEISIDIKNNTGNSYLLLFDRAYTVKELKKMNPSIRFDNVYSSANRNITPCDARSELGPLVIDPDRDESLTFKGFTSDRMQCVMPIYVATYKKKCFLRKAKYLICESETKEVIINIQKKERPDTDYKRVKEACEDLLEELEGKTFCDKKTHKPSFDEQTKDYKEKIQELKDEISDIKSANGWRERSEEYQKYKALIAQLDGIEFNRQYCGECGIKPRPIDRDGHHCKYCSWTAKDAYDYLDQTFNEIHNSEDPQEEKRKYLNDVKALYKAYSSKCVNLKRKVQAAPQIKANADEYYNYIISY